MTAKNALSRTPRRPLPAHLGLFGAQGAKAALLREGEARVVAVKFLILELAAPGMAAGTARPLETLLSPVGEPVAGEGRPVPARARARVYRDGFRSLMGRASGAASEGNAGAPGLSSQAPAPPPGPAWPLAGAG